MTPKEILFQALRHEKTDTIPWVPFAGIHAGKLTGASAGQVLTDENALFDALMAVNRLYQPNGQPVMFDLQIEAEILGCELQWVENSPPSVKTHPLQDTASVPCKCTLPTPEDGRIPMILNVMRRLKDAIGDTTALYGLICGPFTLASHLRGTDLFMDMYDDEDYVHRLLQYCTECCHRMAACYLEAGMDVIAVVDPLVSQISESHFETFLETPFTDIFKMIRDTGAFSSFFVCGDASRNVEGMCKTGPDSISVDENIDLPAAKRITDRYNICISGNIPLTSIMLHGTQQDNMKYVMDLIGQLESTQNFILAPGCDMPYDVPVENSIAVAQAVHQPEMVREMLKNYQAAAIEADIELPDYAQLQKPLVEVFTLDSATCAACTYMLSAAEVAKKHFGDAIDLVEYKYTEKENIARCQKMGVKHLPSIYINGELRFSSLIPSREVLRQAIEAAL